MLVACLVVETIQHWSVAFADPLWPCIKVKVIETGMGRYFMHTSTIMPSWNAIAENEYCPRYGYYSTTLFENKKYYVHLNGEVDEMSWPGKLTYLRHCPSSQCVPAQVCPGHWVAMQYGPVSVAQLFLFVQSMACTLGPCPCCGTIWPCRKVLVRQEDGSRSESALVCTFVFKKCCFILTLSQRLCSP